MSIYTLEKDKVNEFLGKLKTGYNVWAPFHRPEGWTFAPVEAPVHLDGYLLTRLSAKQFVMPIYETLLKFDGSKGEPIPPHEEKRVIFGVRPCDARAIRLMNRTFMGGNYVDPHYKGRADNTVLFVTACNSPAPTCFCTGTGGGPADEFGADVLLYEKGDTWILKTVTGKGAAALEATRLTSAGDAELTEAAAQSSKAAGEMKPLWDLEKAQEAVKTAFTNHQLWHKLADRCLACGVCTYVCSSCSCFDVSDEAKQGKGRRYRFWDGCMFPLFTDHASGHNPRETSAQRYRQRVQHKFNYYPARNDGLNLCVGCGRCVVDCPVNIDIREAVTKALEEQ
ncbi:MAG: hypothetical protein GY765_40225 [bacterium]|nr:hypothetical protein [bacterium]